MPLSREDIEGFPDGMLRGRKRVIFVQHGCPSCEGLITLYQSINSHDPRVPPFVFIEVPNGARDGEDRRMGGGWARLDPGRAWFVKTPAVVDLEDGVVTRVSHY
jgi:hypothetical protein